MPHRGQVEDCHNNHHNNNHYQFDPSMTQCCVPNGCPIGQPIHMTNLTEAIKVICNNDQCKEGKYMHRSCFESWEETVLTFLRSSGRARSWSEKQRLQNLWTKKGYDLAYKACGCKCGKGHLRKDLDWTPPVTSVNDEEANSQKKKKNKKKRGSDKPTVNVSGVNPTACQPKNTGTSPPNGPISGQTNGTISNNNNSSSNGQMSNGHLPARLRSFSMSSTGSGGSSDGISPPASTTCDSPNFKKFFFSDNAKRERHSSGSIFSRRADYSSFNTLPRHKINSYHIKMEDDGNHGNDETRCFILSSLSANKMNRTACVLCQGTMIIFDRYPLVDGTFFLSPRQHNKSAVPVHVDGRVQYMNAVCMSCLEGWSCSIKCKQCQVRWNGSHLILGSMYSYDIFAAVPCCTERLRCNNCGHLVIPPDDKIQYFSFYSTNRPCQHCGIVDHHYVKLLSNMYTIQKACE